MRIRKENVGKTMKYIRNRVASGLSIPPTMTRGTIEYVKSSYWTTLNQRCVNGAHFSDTKKNESYKRKAIKLEIDKEEFHGWVEENWAEFDNLYKAGKTPSIDRINNSIGYELNNMSVIYLFENISKDRCKPVIAISLADGTEKFYKSAREAEKFGFCAKLISRAIKLSGTHKGFRWQFSLNHNSLAND